MPETNALVVAAPRLPYAPHLEGEYGVSLGKWKALTDAIYPSAKTAEGVELALAYCKARNLDPMKKPVHVVPVYSSALGREVEGVWPAISELRTTAMRTGQYAGTEPMEYGADIERSFKWTQGQGQNRQPHEATVTFPEWARLTVWRVVPGVGRVPFVGPKVFWLETFAQVSRWAHAPNEMWRKRPRGQLDKCAEAAALRMAFPEELGNEYAAEEMVGRDIDPVAVPAETASPSPVRTLHAGFAAPGGPPAPAPRTEAPPPPSSAGASAAAEAAEAEADVQEAEFEDLAPPAAPDAPRHPEDPGPPTPGFDVVAWAVAMNRDLDGYADVGVLRADWAEHKDQLKALNPAMFKALNQNVAAHAASLAAKQGGA